MLTHFKLKKIAILLLTTFSVSHLYAEDEILFEKSNGETVKADLNNRKNQVYSSQLNPPQLNITPEVGKEPNKEQGSEEVLFIQNEDYSKPPEVQTPKVNVDKWMSLIQTSNKDYSAIEEALKNGQNINKSIWEGNNMILLAAQQNNIEAVRFAIDHKANIHSVNNAGETPLHWAAYNGNIDMINLLLNNSGKDPKQDLNKSSKTGRTPLHMAAMNKYATETIKILILQGADITAKDVNKQTPAHYSAALRNWNNLEVFMKRNINITEKDNNSLSVDDLLLDRADIEAMIKFFYYVSPTTQKIFDKKLANYPDRPKLNG